MITVLVYSDNRRRRAEVAAAIGDRLPDYSDDVTLIEVATAPAVLKALETDEVDVAVFDGETTPAGGIGLAKQIKDEIDFCPPVVLLIGRQEDAWLAAWSGAEATLPLPVDPIDLPRVITNVLTAAENARR